jgi:oligopeptide transport system ATP-binding protein
MQPAQEVNEMSDKLAVSVHGTLEQDQRSSGVVKAEDARDAILVVEGLKQHFPINRKFTVKAVDGVSFHIKKGETYGLVGESGSGKSTIGRSVIRLYEPTAGTITFAGRDISGKLTKDNESYLRSKMQMIFQDPMASLNPRQKVFDIVSQGVVLHKLAKNAQEQREMVYSILERVGLSPDFASRYPHQFSGGQRQRIGIARALIMNPDLIIADEAISALDVSIQAQIVNLMREIQRETNISYLFISHSLSMIKYISDRIGVLHLGHMIETGTTDEIFQNPVHPYTQSLLSANPIANPVVERKRVALTYDYATSGIDYNQGILRSDGGTHYVRATEAELAKWTTHNSQA